MTLQKVSTIIIAIALSVISLGFSAYLVSRDGYYGAGFYIATLCLTPYFMIFLMPFILPSVWIAFDVGAHSIKTLILWVIGGIGFSVGLSAFLVYVGNITGDKAIAYPFWFTVFSFVISGTVLPLTALLFIARQNHILYVKLLNSDPEALAMMEQ